MTSAGYFSTLSTTEDGGKGQKRTQSDSCIFQGFGLSAPSNDLSGTVITPEV